MEDWKRIVGKTDIWDHSGRKVPNEGSAPSAAVGGGASGSGGGLGVEGAATTPQQLPSQPSTPAKSKTKPTGKLQLQGWA